jgi:hypothetical protein
MYSLEVHFLGLGTAQFLLNSVSVSMNSSRESSSSPSSSIPYFIELVLYFVILGE